MKIEITNQVKDDFLASLKTLISYPSVLNEGENGTPFGQAIQDVLEKTLIQLLQRNKNKSLCSLC